ncbi:DUF2244 domain-containing protein [Oceanomicrobium pacificus]|uniref:DUF2244 domain-containing protein n=1 Tax=Oceanomicrobium pacificus TaxID=2692916 RepID=A0A6B0TW41_9RHOB|nr:DUF2244 domain-containing protein [Oceanomicrobium pacificus]MXU65965.1 DUF2244 domain-containing protein [Oceanomicrobium pacificus]
MAEFDKDRNGAGADASAPRRSGDADGLRPSDRRPPLPATEPLYAVTLWPHRSLSETGFRTLLLIVFAGLVIPVLPFLGSPVALVLILFALATLALLWLLLRRNYRDARLQEDLRLWRGLILVERREADGRERIWHADPTWVGLTCREQGGPVDHYLTLTGNGRTIELGAFLSPEERQQLSEELDAALTRARSADHPANG